MDFKKLSQEHIEKILELLEKGKGEKQILERFDNSLASDVRAFIHFEQQLQHSSKSFLPNETLLKTILFKLPQTQTRNTVRTRVLSPLFFGKLMAPVALFALILVLAHDNQWITGTPSTPVATETQTPQLMKVAATQPITKEEKRVKAEAIVAGLSKVATANPSVDQTQTPDTTVASPSFNALYE